MRDFDSPDDPDDDETADGAPGALADAASPAPLTLPSASVYESCESVGDTSSDIPAHPP